MFAVTSRGDSAGIATALAAGSPSIAVTAPGGGPSGPAASAGPAPPRLSLVRVSGADRIATSVAASQISFPAGGSATAVVLARADTFADALAGTPLAVAKGGPLLLTTSGALSAATAAEITRVLAPGGVVYLLGGTSALSTAVGDATVALGHPVVRFAGPDRFATAVAVAGGIGTASAVLEADGTTYADALSAGAAAAASHAVILLTNGNSAATETTAYLASHPGLTRYAIGGPATHADPGATPFAGADRFTTSVLVAQRFFPTPTCVGLASAATFPDALSGGAVTATHGGPLLLVPATGTLPPALTSYLSAAAATATAGWLFGGTSSVGSDVFTEASNSLTPPA